MEQFDLLSFTMDVLDRLDITYLLFGTSTHREDRGERRPSDSFSRHMDFRSESHQPRRGDRP